MNPSYRSSPGWAARHILLANDVASLAATWMTCVGVSAACSGLMGARPAPASNAASDALRINVFMAQCPVGMSLRSLRSFISVSTACSRRDHLSIAP